MTSDDEDISRTVERGIGKGKWGWQAGSSDKCLPCKHEALNSSSTK
jgi:hypothetical protein